ncbi:hypothetical protein NC651_008414 [Populus alba x Populus x berolinensis]|nr:hypothetical protein NC651_008414 [Populus alba x Populus x berolinensis]
MDAEKTLKKSISFPSRSSIPEHGDPPLHRQIALPLPPSYLQGTCVSHMDDDPFFHLSWP